MEIVMHAKLSDRICGVTLDPALRILLCLLVTAALSAQTQSSGTSGSSTSRGSTSTGGQSGGSTTSRTPTTSNTNSNSSSSRSTYNNQRRSLENLQMPRVLFLHGRVVLANGERPPERVVVKMQCGTGSPRPQAYTDSKGRFSFQPGGDSTLMVSDASVSGHGRGLGPSASGRMTTNLAGCELLVDLPGYRSDRLALRYYHAVGSKDVGTIVLHALAGVTGDTVSATSWSAPKSASKAYRKGLQALMRAEPNLKRGIELMEEAVAAYPQYAAAWSVLGMARLESEDWDGARDALLKSIEADSKYLRPYEPLIDLAYERKDWSMVDSLAGEYLKLSPNSSRIRFRAAMAAARIGKTDRAEELIGNLIDRQEANRWPGSFAVLGLIHEHRAEYPQAAGFYRQFLRHESQGDTVKRLKRTLYEWEMLRVIEPVADSPQTASGDPANAPPRDPTLESPQDPAASLKFAQNAPHASP